MLEGEKNSIKFHMLYRCEHPIFLFTCYNVWCFIPSEGNFETRKNLLHQNNVKFGEFSTWNAIFNNVRWGKISVWVSLTTENLFQVIELRWAAQIGHEIASFPVYFPVLLQRGKVKATTWLDITACNESFAVGKLSRLEKSLENSVSLSRESEEGKKSEWKSSSTPSPASERAAQKKKLCTISIRLSSEGGNDEKIQFNVQLKFPSIFYLRLPSHCAKDGHSFFHLYDYEYKWVWFL